MLPSVRFTDRTTMLRTIVLVLVVFVLIRLFFPALGELVQHVLELGLNLIEQLLSAAAGSLPS